MLKVKPGFEIQNVCGQYVLLAMGEENIDFSKVITLNETSYFVWNKLSEGVETIDGLIDAMTSEYEVDNETARKDITNLLEDFLKVGVIENKE